MKYGFCAAMAAIFSLIACGTTRDFGSDLIPAKPAVGDWGEVGAAVLDDSATLSYRVVGGDRIVAVLDHRRRIKILGENGLGWATVRLPVDGFSKVTNIRARSLDASGRETLLDSRSIENRPWQGERRRDPLLTELTFKIPGAGIGGVVEYRYERIYLDADFVEPWGLGGRLPRVRSQLDIVVPPSMRIEYRTGEGGTLTDGAPLRRKTDDGGERLVFVKKDVKPYYLEPRMVHPLRLVPWVASMIVEADLPGGKRRVQTWEAIRKKVEAMVLDVGSGGKGKGSPENRFAKIRDKVRGLDVLGLGIKEPSSATMLMNGETGVSRDIAAMLTKRMRGSELPAYYALVSSDLGPPLVEGMPSIYPFVRAVVAVDVSERIAEDASCEEDPINQGLLCTIPDDAYAFLDPLCRTCRFGELPLELTDGRALVFKPGKAEWVDVPADPPQRNRRITQWLYRLSIQGELSGAMSGKLTGAPAREVRQALLNQKKPKIDPVETVLLGEETPVDLFKGEYQNLRVIERDLAINAKAKSEAKKLGYERFQLRPVDLAGPSLPGRWRFSRRSPSLMPGPSWTETAVRVELPVGYEVELPEVVKLVTPFAEYAAGYGLRERSLTYQRRLVLKKRRIEPDDWDEFRGFLAKIEAAEAEGVVVGFEER
ncbi:MAG: DUF3857 domain-containing protein [Myxococcota bacterium]